MTVTNYGMCWGEMGWVEEKVGEHAVTHTHTHTSVTAVASVPFSF